jgi:hypothetical protein
MKRIKEQEEALVAFLEAAEAVEEGANHLQRMSALGQVAAKDPQAAAVVKGITSGPDKVKNLVASLRKKSAATNAAGGPISRTAKVRSVAPPIPADAKKKSVGEASDLPMSKIQKDISLLAMKNKHPEALKNAMAGGKNLVMALRKKAAKERQSGKSIVNRHATSSPTQVRDPMDRPKAKAESVEPVIETITKQGNKFVIKSKDGKKRLGEYSTHEQALKRLRQIEFFKNEDQELDIFHALGMPKKEEYFIDEEIEEDYLE